MKHISSIDRGDVKLAYDRAVAHDVEDVADMLEAFAEYIDRLEKQRDELLAALEKMNRAYVILMESARDRICDLGGECDGIEVMERNDPYLRESRAAIAGVKGEQ